MEFHEYANIFPMMTAEEHAGLCDSMRKHGFDRDAPIITYGGKILDGRNRYKASSDTGTPPVFKAFDGDDQSALNFVMRHNLERRHLSPSQKAGVGLDMLPHHEALAKERQLATLKKGDELPDVEKFPQRENSKSRDEVAAIVGVNPRYISDAKAIQDAAPEVMQEVRNGNLNIPQAKAIAKMPEVKHAEVIEKVRSGVKPVEAMRQVKKEELNEKSANLPPNKYRVIYADPPWQYNDSKAGIMQGTGAANHYPTMPTKDICEMQIKDIAADDSVLFMWATFPLLTDALEVVKAWGFKYKTAFVWDKVRPNFGNYHTANAEILIVATKGSGTPETEKRESQVQTVERTGRHSEKPEHFRDMIMRLYPTGRKIELFRRGEAPEGWEVWGNESV